MRQRKGGETMIYIYLKPQLKDLTQGSRIAFIRAFRKLTQDDVSDKMGLTGENKRRTIARYEMGTRMPKEDRLLKIADILNINIDAIREYNFKNPINIIYILIWLEELYPNVNMELPITNYDRNNEILGNFIIEWNLMREKRRNRKITYEQYFEWKINYSKSMEGEVNERSNKN